MTAPSKDPELLVCAVCRSRWLLTDPPALKYASYGCPSCLDGLAPHIRLNPDAPLIPLPTNQPTSENPELWICSECRSHWTLTDSAPPALEAGYHGCPTCRELARRSPLHEAVDHPAHYGGADNPYEAIRVIEAWRLGFCLGNTIKYIVRADHKGNAIEDLEKARWYLDHEIARRKQEEQKT